MKKFFKSFLLVLVFSLALSTTGFAKSDHAKKSLVALGDSIAYGYNLGINNDHPSKLAYPYLIGQKADMRVRDLAEPGWTTTQMLNAVIHDEKYRTEISHADAITLSIGNNDLLGALRASGNDQNALKLELAKTIPLLTSNLTKIVSEIRELTDAPIVIYDIYNPFQLTDQPLNFLASTLLNNPDPTKMDINDLLQLQTTLLNHTYSNIHLADAYSAFGDTGQFVRVGDIHPTIEGQEILAYIGLDALGLK